MNVLQRVFCRVYQTAFHMALPVLPYREPQRFDRVADLAPLLEKLQVTSVLLVTDFHLRTAGITGELEALLARLGIHCAVYEGVQPNPTVDNVEEALALYHRDGCQCLIAMGGGSSMDCAKAVGARVTYPNRGLNQLKGNLRILRKIPPLIAIPTTAGTGSEVTLTAVITDSAAKHKYTMNSFPLIPSHAVLDPSVTVSLPPHLTATTGMDALTHAVEAYLGNSTSRQTRAWALEAVSLVFANIEIAYQDGANLQARANMLKAAYLAGAAFSQSYVGYVHAVAHSLGGQYGIPHGLANAVLLPVFLEAYGAKIHKKLHKLAIAAGLATEETPRMEAAEAFIRAVRGLNHRMNIPETLPGIRREDIPQMARHAGREANPLYPVPVLMNSRQLQWFYYKVAEERNAHGRSTHQANPGKPA